MAKKLRKKVFKKAWIPKWPPSVWQIDEDQNDSGKCVSIPVRVTIEELSVEPKRKDKANG